MKEMRPTTGIAVLALFNILGNIRGLSFLDLFSGSGRVAFEAARRGAAPVVSVEYDRRRFAEIVKKNERGVKCVCADVRRAVAQFAKQGEKFDIIFADPPYNLGWGVEFINLMEERVEILNRGGVLILERSAKETPKELSAALWEQKNRTYGQTVLSFFTRRNDFD